MRACQTTSNRQLQLPIVDLECDSPARICEQLAKGHCENFTVGSFFLPRGLRRHVYNVYAYCRICDDLADETGDPELSLRLLNWWRTELHKCFDEHPEHPVFLALSETIQEFALPIQPFEDLISAFEQDQKTTRYETFDQLLEYCSRSANPVGRIFLHLVGHAEEESFRLSDVTCTALQLANFWQDVGADYQKGRIYIPQEDMIRFGYSEAELRNNIVNAGFVQLMQFEIERTRELFQHGAVLPHFISGVGSADVELFTMGGLAVLKAIERIHYNVFRKRASVPKSVKTKLMMGWCAKRFAQAVFHS